MFRKWHLSVLVTALGLALIACDDTPTQPEAVVSELNLDAVDYNSWYFGEGAWLDPCTGEIYDYDYQIHGVYKFFHPDASGGVHHRVHENMKYTGIGRDTGIKYEGSLIYNMHWMAPSSGSLSWSSTIVDRVSSQGSAPNTVDIYWDRHQTVNANGETTAYWWKPGEIVCRGL